MYDVWTTIVTTQENVNSVDISNIKSRKKAKEIAKALSIILPREPVCISRHKENEPLEHYWNGKYRKG